MTNPCTGSVRGPPRLSCCILVGNREAQLPARVLPYARGLDKLIDCGCRQLLFLLVSSLVGGGVGVLVAVIAGLMLPTFAHRQTTLGSRGKRSEEPDNDPRKTAGRRINMKIDTESQVDSPLFSPRVGTMTKFSSASFSEYTRLWGSSCHQSSGNW